MKLVNAKYNLQVEMRENVTDCIIIENPTSMSNIVSELWAQCNGGEGNFILSQEKSLKIEKDMDIVLNPFALDFNSRKITAALYSNLVQSANSYVLEKAHLNSQIIQLLDQIMLDQIYSGIEYNMDFDWNDLFKLYGVKIAREYDSLLEKLVEYVKIMASLCNVKVICFVNLKCYLNQEEILEFIRAVNYNKIQLVLIEAHETERLVDERIYIIDKDNCLIAR